ncbi:hypothetical protein M9H77_29881 [Catharanthus roseus]|uniref:Uncharacterized protein n=1 Tax=Catharanthus roseus TaxID=4058 RepID=A0ACB9ZXM6_CATRO|nr:hypothetical protein M9H77_29881 [Catharanthus roseus]
MKCIAFGICRKNLGSSLTTLVNLDDLDGEEKILEEWLARTSYFNNGIPNQLLTATSKKGHKEKAESLNWALAVSTLGWGPDVTTLTRCLENLKEKGDDDGAKEIEGLLEKQSKDSCTV